jgi:hypothetical protein
MRFFGEIVDEVLAIRTFMPCMNFSEDREFREATSFSLTK